MSVVEKITLEDASDLAAARQRASDLAAEVLRPGRVADVALVVSELATNALEHGTGFDAVVALAIEDCCLVVSVASDAATLPLVATAQVPPEQLTGRGLRIVSDLVDSISVETEGRRVEVACRFERRPDSVSGDAAAS